MQTTKTSFELELSNIDLTLARASECDVAGLKTAIASASQGSMIAVGSGGSYTASSLFSGLHESYTGHVSRAITPLELICNPTLASSSPIFLISAEGKNPDIIEALHRACQYSSRTVHVVTNRLNSPLMEQVEKLNDVTSHVFELIQKDGYLATNSLVLDACLIARAYEELDQSSVSGPLSVEKVRLDGLSIAEWAASATEFVESVLSNRGLIIVYSPRLRSIAEDLESKFSEAALLFVQLADFRSFAHGRHLWLTERLSNSALLVLSEPSTEKLWEDMLPRIPAEVPRFVLPLQGSGPQDLIGGLIASMHLVSEIANGANRDIAKPKVYPLGKNLYYTNLSGLIPPPGTSESGAEVSKYDVLGAHWPAPRNSGKIRRALQSVFQEFEMRRFRAIVFDYDGTLCSSNGNDRPPPKDVADQLLRLTQGGVIVGVASGRGDSILEHLEKILPTSVWSKVHMGLYNGGWIGQLGNRPSKTETPSEFLIHANRVTSGLKSIGVPIESIRSTPPYQLSVRLSSGVDAADMWFVIVDALKQAGLHTETVFRSKHSIDILSEGVSKSHLVASISQQQGIDPYEIVTMGDLGAWPGNDSSLLQHKFSLSVDLPSRRLDRGWKLAPRYKRDVDAALWYLSRLSLHGDSTFSLSFSEDST